MRKGLLAAVAGLLVLAVAAAAYLYSRGLHGVILDSAQVEAMARAMLPGAAPPPGTRGVLGLQLEKAEVAVFAPSLDKSSPDALQGSDLRIVIAAVGSPDEQQSMAEIRAAMEEQKARKQAKLTEQSHSVVRLQAGGSPHPARRTLYTVVDGGAKVLEYTLLFRLDRPVVVQIMGPEATFDEASMTSFLAALQVPAGPGAEARERLQERAGEVRDRAAETRERAEDAREKAEAARAQAEAAREKAAEARAQAEQARQKAGAAREKVTEVREEASEVRDEAAEVRDRAAERREERRERRGR